MSAQEETLLCLLEKKRFPASEFEDTEKWGLVHRVEPPHTIGGDPVGSSIPGPPEIPGPPAELAPEPLQGNTGLEGSPASSQDDQDR